MNNSPAPTGAYSRAECVAIAKKAHLHYATDDAPGIRRVRKGNGFGYRSPRGASVTHTHTLARIRKLAIPPAWSDVWICPSPMGHLQATGRDAKGRKQYRYHERWRAIRDENKFDRLLDFARVLPRIRRRVRRDLKLSGLPRDKVLATVVRLLETTLIRVGNEEYTRQNGSFGLTTLRNPHAHIHKDEITFQFRGKSGIRHCVTVHDRRLASIVSRCREIPGQHLFQYLDDDGKRHAIGSADVNDYLKAAAAGDFTAKDFRTWAATLLAARVFNRCAESAKKATKASLVQCIDEVARQLGNTTAVCRKCYIHPVLIKAYLGGSLTKTLRRPMEARSDHSTSTLSSEETALLHWLREQN